MEEDLIAIMELLKETMRKNNIKYCNVSYIDGWVSTDTKKNDSEMYHSITLKENGVIYKI